MTTQSDETEISNLVKYGAELQKSAFCALTSLNDSSNMIQSRNLYSILKRRCEVEREILQFIDRASKVKWTVESFKSSLIAQFYRLAREYFGVYERPDDCADCNEHCYDERYCICLSEELHMYGCLKHASIHECVKKTVKRGSTTMIVPPDCPCRGTSLQTDEVCVFSGTVISKVLMDGTGSSKDFSSDDAVTRTQAGYQFLLSMNQAEEIRNRFENADVLKRRTLNLRKKPAQKPAVSQIIIKLDEDGTPLSQESRDITAAEPDGVPELVRSNSANSSSDSVVMRPSSEQTISRKRLMEQASKEKKARLANSNYFEFRKVAIIEEAERYLRSVAETILTDIMYDKEARTLINEEQLFRYMAEMKKSLNTYHWTQKRANVMPNFVSCLASFDTPRDRLKMLRLVDHNIEQVSVFCGRVVTLWRLCHRSPAVLEKKIALTTFKKFTVALLYYMRQGLSIPTQGMVWTDTGLSEKILVLQRDPIIAIDLPDENLLCHFGKKAREALAATLNKGGTIRPSASNSQQKQNTKPSRLESIPQRIEVDGIGTVMTRTFLPLYLHDEWIEDTSCYCASDVAAGLSFFKECVASFSEASRRCLAFS